MYLGVKLCHRIFLFRQKNETFYKETLRSEKPFFGGTGWMAEPWSPRETISGQFGPKFFSPFRAPPPPKKKKLKKRKCVILTTTGWEVWTRDLPRPLASNVSLVIGHLSGNYATRQLPNHATTLLLYCSSTLRCNYATKQLCNYSIMQFRNYAIMDLWNYAATLQWTLQLYNYATT